MDNLRWLAFYCFTVRIRAIPIRSDARPWLEPVDLFLNDPRGMEMARWSARSAANGPIQVLVRFESHLMKECFWRCFTDSHNISLYILLLSVCLLVCLSTNPDLPDQTELHISSYLQTKKTQHWILVTTFSMVAYFSDIFQFIFIPFTFFSL